ncbi:MAG: HIT family protein [Bacteroidia bacterium]|nr:HIT family protein [Bacteroidia bacterium]MCZ2276529.1 HIT family protein [Bacteroidia bacterium]
MATLFSRIISGEIPCYKIAENKDFFAFLDINPVKKGHVLVVTRQETDYLFNLEDSLMERIMPFCKVVAHAIEKAIPCSRIGIAVVGLEVPHVHIHLIPINSVDDINFSKAKQKFSDDEMRQICNNIREFLPASIL